MKFSLIAAAIVGVRRSLILGLIFARLYKRASKETAFVRTGFGGEKVVMNGGALVLPVLHETISVNMNTLRLALVGAGKGPGMYDVTSFIGKEETLRRIDNLLTNLKPAIE